MFNLIVRTCTSRMNVNVIAEVWGSYAATTTKQYYAILQNKRPRWLVAPPASR